jgi:hypothetical protein
MQKRFLGLDDLRFRSGGLSTVNDCCRSNDGALQRVVTEPFLSPAHLEDCRDQEKDETRNRGEHSDDMERQPAIAKLLPVPR